MKSPSNVLTAQKAGLARQFSPLSVLKAQRWPLLTLIGGIALLVVAAVYHYAIYLPQPTQPHRLTLLDDVFALGLVIIVGFVGLGLGRRLLSRFQLQGLSRLEQSALALGLGWGVLSLAVLALGMAHLLYVWVLVAGLALALMVFWRDLWRALVTLTSRRWYPSLKAIAPRAPFEIALSLIVEIAFLLLATKALTLPLNPRGWDLYTYHWAAPRLFLLHHAVYALPGWANADFPLNTEMLDLLALAFNAPIAAVLIQVVFGLLAVLLLAGFLYRRFGRLSAWLGAALCLASPLYTGYLTSGYVEPATAYFSVASLVIVLLWLERQTPEGIAQDTGLLLLAGMLAGLGVGAKYQFGLTVVGMVLFLVGIGASQFLRARCAGSSTSHVLKRVFSGLLLYGAGVLLPLLPWLLKDWLLLGNPIYPFVWGGPDWNASRTQVATEWLAHFGPGGPLWQRWSEAFLQFFLSLWPVEELPYLPLNPLLLLAPFLAVLALARYWRRQASQATRERGSAAQEYAWLVVPAVAYSIWVAVQTTSNRYALSWVMLLVVPAVIVWLRLWQLAWRLRPMRQLVQAATLLLLLVGPLLSLGFWLDVKPLSLLTGQVSLRSWEEQQLHQSAGYWHMVDYVNSQIPAEAKLLLVGNGFGYFLEGHDYVDDSAEDWVPYLVTEGRTPAGIAALLRQQGFQYLVYEEQNLEFIAHDYQATSIDTYLPAFHQFLASALVQVQVFGDYTLYRIPSS